MFHEVVSDNISNKFRKPRVQGLLLGVNSKNSMKIAVLSQRLVKGENTELIQITNHPKHRCKGQKLKLLQLSRWHLVLVRGKKLKQELSNSQMCQMLWLQKAFLNCNPLGETEVGKWPCKNGFVFKASTATETHQLSFKCKCFTVKKRARIRYEKGGEKPP